MRLGQWEKASTVKLHRGRSLVAAGLTVTSIVLGTSGTAFSAESREDPGMYVAAGDHGRFLAKGLEVDVTVVISCDASFFFEPFGATYDLTASVFVTVDERWGRTISKGSGSAATVPCTGALTTVTARVFADNQPFKKGGTAVVTATLSANLGDTGLAFTLTDKQPAVIK
jgi:hypothetical protein